MSNNPRTLPLALVTSTRAGSDPDVIEIEDCTEVYGDWPEIDTPCDSMSNPGDQCVYGGPNDRECIYCGKPSGLDR